MIHYP